MNFTIVETGSTGNAVIFNDVVMVDCGVSFKKLAPYYQKLQVVLLTHIHSDHFCKATIRRLAEERPALRFATPAWLVEPLVSCGVSKSNIDVFEMMMPYVYSFGRIGAFELNHDVPNCGYKIILNSGLSIVYATDTASLPDLPGCDYYFIEANYKNQEELAARIAAKMETGDHIYEQRVAENHMSEEYALNWLYRNGRPDSKHVFLHEHREG